MEALLDEKEIIAAAIDEIEIGMITARGGKLKSLRNELYELESKKDAVKARIKALAAQGGGGAAAVPPPAKPPQMGGTGAGGKATGPKKMLKKRWTKKKQGGGYVPPKKASGKEEEELRALELELEQLERQVEEKEDEERRLRFEMDSRKREMLEEESAIYEREQAVLKLEMQNDSFVTHVVKVQRIARANFMKKRWKNGREPAVKAIVEQYVASEDAHAGKSRWNLIMEFYKSQKLYVNQTLRVIRDKYATPIRRAGEAASGMSQDDIQEVFGTLEVIASFEIDILEALQLRLFSRFSHPSVGDLLLRLSTIFPMYVDYCRGLDDTFATAARLQKSPNFPDFVEKLFLNSNSRAPLATLLGVPAQRIFQYETILTALTQLTPSMHADHSQLKATYKTASDAVSQIKLFQEEKKAAQKLASLSKRISHLPASVVRPGRKLLIEQNVTLLESRKRVRQRIFLFDDLIVMTAASSRSLKFVEEVPLLGIRFHSLMDNDSVYNGFELQTMTKLWTFVCDSYDSKMEFESIIVSALSRVNKISIDGLQTNDKNDGGSGGSGVSSGNSGAGGNVGLQKVRLEGEIRAMSENVSRLPKESAEKLLSSRFSALVTLVEDPAVLSALFLDPESLALATKVLESNGTLFSTIKALGKSFLQSVGSGDEKAAVAALKKETLLTSLVGHGAALLAKDWVKGIVGKSINASSDEEVASQLVKDIAGAMKTAPIFVQGVVFLFRHLANKKYRGSTGGDEVSFAFFAASILGFALRWPERFGVQAKARPNAVHAVMKQKPVAGVVDACKDQKGKLSPSISKASCEKDVLPKLLENMVRDIEAFNGEKVCKALAAAIVLKK